MREWKTERGERQTRLELRADMVHFLDRRPADDAGAVGGAAEAAQAEAPRPDARDTRRGTGRSNPKRT